MQSSVIIQINWTISFYFGNLVKFASRRSFQTQVQTPKFPDAEFVLFWQVFTEYFKELEEESIQDNFVVVYELLDELMDFGFPQTTDSKILQEWDSHSYSLVNYLTRKVCFLIIMWCRLYFVLQIHNSGRCKAGGGKEQGPHHCHQCGVLAVGGHQIQKEWGFHWCNWVHQCTGKMKSGLQFSFTNSFTQTVKWNQNKCKHKTWIQIIVALKKNQKNRAFL